MPKHLSKSLFALAVVAVVFFTGNSDSPAQTQYNVTIDTAGLAGTTGLFAFDLVGTNSINSLSIYSFQTDGMLTPGSNLNTTGAMGDLPAPVLISNLEYFNESTRGIIFGTTISFTLNMTEQYASPYLPDEFSFFLLDADGQQILIDTDDPTGAGALFTVDVTGQFGGNLTVFSSNTPGISWSVVPPPANIRGYLQLEAVNDLTLVSPYAPLGTFTFDFRKPGTANVVFTTNMTLTPVAGTPYAFYERDGVPSGTYDIAIKGSKNLRVVLPTVVVYGDTYLPTQSLMAGDANNDNAIDLGDFGVLVSAYESDATIPDSVYDPNADFNFDGLVNVTDFGFLVNNYGLAGQ